MAGPSSNFTDDDAGALSDINIVPLVDVILVLLIVFMLTVPQVVGSAQVKADLPTTEAGAIDQLEKLPTHIIMKRNEAGRIELYLGDDVTNETKIRAHLKSLGNKPEDQAVNIAADKGIPYGEVVKVMDMLAQLGLHKISLDTKHVSHK